jgi:hypothetical protein
LRQELAELCGTRTRFSAWFVLTSKTREGSPTVLLRDIRLYGTAREDLLADHIWIVRLSAQEMARMDPGRGDVVHFDASVSGYNKYGPPPERNRVKGKLKKRKPLERDFCLEDLSNIAIERTARNVILAR